MASSKQGAKEKGAKDLVPGEKKRAKPTKYTPQLAQKVLTVIANGGTFKDASKKVGTPKQTLSKWLNEYNKDELMQAYRMRADHLVDKMKDYEQMMIDGKIDPPTYREIKDRIKWQAARENRMLYGDQPLVEIKNQITLADALNQIKTIEGDATTE